MKRLTIVLLLSLLTVVSCAPLSSLSPQPPATPIPPSSTPLPTQPVATPVPPSNTPLPTQPAATSVQPSSTPLPTQPVATPVPVETPVDLPDDALAIYVKSGGIAGMYEKLTVYQSGNLEVTERNGNTRSAQVDHAQLTPLRNMLAQPDFAQLEPLYQASGADLFVYTLTARDQNGQTRTVTTMDAAKTPPFLGQLITILEQLRMQVK